MRVFFLFVLLGLTFGYGQETQTEDKAAAAAATRFKKELDDGKEFPLVALRPLVKLDKGDLRCGRYFLLTDDVERSTGKTVSTMVVLANVNANGDMSSMQYKVEDYELRVSDSKKVPTIAKQKRGGVSKIVLTVSSGDLADARMCLGLPDVRTAKK